jgi:hypothetical protein
VIAPRFTMSVYPAPTDLSWPADSRRQRAWTEWHHARTGRARSPRLSRRGRRYTAAHSTAAATRTMLVDRDRGTRAAPSGQLDPPFAVENGGCRPSTYTPQRVQLPAKRRIGHERAPGCERSRSATRRAAGRCAEAVGVLQRAGKRLRREASASCGSPVLGRRNASTAPTCRR